MTQLTQSEKDHLKYIETLSDEIADRIMGESTPKDQPKDNQTKDYSIPENPEDKK